MEFADALSLLPDRHADALRFEAAGCRPASLTALLEVEHDAVPAALAEAKAKLSLQWRMWAAPSGAAAR